MLLGGLTAAQRRAADAERRITWADAETVLDGFMVAGEPNADRFRESILGVLEPGTCGIEPSRVYAYGEMVSLLAARRNFGAARRLEQLWNELQRERGFSLCCGYAASLFGPDDSDAFDGVCRLHTDLLPGPAWKHLRSVGQRRRIVGLEHTARLHEAAGHRRQRMEDELACMREASAALVRSLAADGSPDGTIATPHPPLMIWSSGADARCDYFNDGWLDFTGRRLEEEAGDGWAAGVHVDDLERCLATYRSAFARREPFRMEYRLRRRDGAYRRILDAGTPRFAEAGAFLGYIGGCIDVTELRDAQDRRDTLHARLERVAQEWTRAFDSLDLGVFVLDEAGVVRRLNRAGLLLAGAQRYEDVIGRPLSDLAGAAPWQTARELAAGARGGSCSRSIPPRGDARSWDIGAAPIVTREGTSLWSIITVRDTTEVSRLQDALRHSESMAALGALVSGVAHEVRNPLCGISATVQLFESRLGDRPELRECAAMLNGNVQRLLELMQELLDYARPVEPVFAEGSLADVVNDAVRACLGLAEARGVEIRCVLPALPRLPLDRRRLTQVFENVVSNAIAFSPPASTVAIAARADPESVRCEIEDSGVGFAAEEIARVFDPFFSRRRDGTGLGLSIARRIVEAHGGSIAAANRSGGNGALITITLPRVRSATSPRP
jgi:PAS domain S-box-containing protein